MRERAAVFADKDRGDTVLTGVIHPQVEGAGGSSKSAMIAALKYVQLHKGSPALWTTLLLRGYALKSVKKRKPSYHTSPRKSHFTVWALPEFFVFPLDQAVNSTRFSFLRLLSLDTNWICKCIWLHCFLSSDTVLLAVREQLFYWVTFMRLNPLSYNSSFSNTN